MEKQTKTMGKTIAIEGLNPLRTNWREIDEAIKRESQAEDCMIPMRDRIY